MKLLVGAAMVVAFAAQSATAQFLFFRVEGQPLTPGGPSVQSTTDLYQPALSADGQTLAFSASSGNNLVAGLTTNGAQVLVFSLATGAIELASTSPAGQPSAPSSTNEHVAVSADGRYIAFETMSTTYTGGVAGIHLVRVDRQTHQHSRLNVDVANQLPAGTIAKLGGISADGRFVAFTSNAANLTPGGASNNTYSVFVRDVSAGVTQRVDVSSSGTPGNGGSHSYRPTLSADGRSVAFASTASNLVGGSLSGSQRIYLRDLQAGVTTRISIGPGGSDLSGASNPAISPNGQWVVFGSGSGGSSATQLWVPGLASPAAVAVPAASGMSICAHGRIADSGFVIAQCSHANANLPSQAYVWQLTNPSAPPALVSGSDPANTIPGNGIAGAGVTTSVNNGVFAFDADANNLVAIDTNNASDVFVYLDPSLLDLIFRDGFE